MKLSNQLGAVIALSLMTTTSAFAYSFGGGGDIAIKFGDVSWLIDSDGTLEKGTDYIMQVDELAAGLTAGDELNFAFQITSIQEGDENGPAIPGNDLAGTEELAGLVTGLLVSETSFSFNSSGIATNVAVNFTDGDWAVYHDTTPDYNITSLASTIEGVSGNDAVQVIGGTFGLMANNTIGVGSFTGIVAADTTYTSQLNLISGAGNLGASKGFWHETFDGNTFVEDNYGTDLELSVESTLVLDRSAGGDTPLWATVTSNDPTSATVIPEPSSIAILGLGMLGMGAVTRRKKV